MTKRNPFAACLAGILMWSVNTAAAELPGPPKIDAGHYLNYVKVLASEKMKGRGTGSKELEAAAAMEREAG